MTKKKEEIMFDGHDRGFEIGVYNRDETEDYEKYLEICYEVEENSRQFSPFEFTAKELNDLEETEDFEVWEAFELGIQDGIEEAWNTK